MDIHSFFDFILHLDVYLNTLAGSLGIWMYVFIFAIIFCETGLVIAPFLPGDSFLFAIGALCATENAVLEVKVCLILLFIAAVLGDSTNYWIGEKFGNWILSRKRPLIRPEHLEKTRHFYAKYGGKTIIIARFAPIVRTLAPFVAGLGSMEYRKFFIYNVVGGFLWVSSFILAGYFFGNLPAVKSNFHYIILGIIVLSLMPIAVEYLKSRRTKKF